MCVSMISGENQHDPWSLYECVNLFGHEIVYYEQVVNGRTKTIQAFMAQRAVLGLIKCYACEKRKSKININNDNISNELKDLKVCKNSFCNKGLLSCKFCHCWNKRGKRIFVPSNLISLLSGDEITSRALSLPPGLEINTILKE